MKKSIQPKDIPHWIRIGCLNEKHWKDTIHQLSMLHESGAISQRTLLECLGLSGNLFDEEGY
jgi:hypothetical protein